MYIRLVNKRMSDVYGDHVILRIKFQCSEKNDRSQKIET